MRKRKNNQKQKQTNNQTTTKPRNIFSMKIALVFQYFETFVGQKKIQIKPGSLVSEGSDWQYKTLWVGKANKDLYYIDLRKCSLA